MTRIKDVSALPKSSSKEMLRITEAALALDWSVAISRQGVVALTAPPPNQGIRHTMRPNQKIDVQRIVRSVITNGNQVKAGALRQAMAGEDDGFLPKGASDAIAQMFTDIGAGERSHIAEADEPIEPTGPTKAQAKRARVPRHIVSKQPMMAKASEGRAYQSKIADERHYSDGTIDYKCVLCEYTSENRLSIRGHRQKHVNSGEVAKLERDARAGEVFEADVPNAATYNPRQTRIKALAAVLESFIANGGDPEEVALQALVWIHQQSKSNTEHAESREREAFTSDEILEQVRNLVGGGINAQQTAQIAELELVNTQLLTRLEVTEAEMEALRADAVEARAERDQCAADLERVRNDLASLKELIGSIQ